MPTQSLLDFANRDKAKANPTRWEAAKQVSPPAFPGPSYVAKFDEARLKGQQARIYACMKDGRYRTLSEISRLCHPAPEASVSAMLRMFRRPIAKGGLGLKVDKNRRGDPSRGLWEYSVKVTQQEPPK